ncbi:hypothetical protein [Halosegnis sp.]|uniref:hypothetical protein n=1 Tax=Halosegnis sp. TaxID=2864959 RepID=UPI0035D52817
MNGQPSRRDDRSVPIEVTLAGDDDERPSVVDGSRLDVAVDGRLYPTAELHDGGYLAWWFTAGDTPAPDADVTTEWVAAPTRFLAAATLRELWEDPAAFDRLVESSRS